MDIHKHNSKYCLLQASRFQLTLLYVMLNEVCIVEVFWSHILLSSFLNHLIFFG
jgi:hypothetical protein